MEIICNRPVSPKKPSSIGRDTSIVVRSRFEAARQTHGFYEKTDPLPYRVRACRASNVKRLPRNTLANRSCLPCINESDSARSRVSHARSIYSSRISSRYQVFWSVSKIFKTTSGSVFYSFRSFVLRYGLVVGIVFSIFEGEGRLQSYKLRVSVF